MIMLIKQKLSLVATAVASITLSTMAGAAGTQLDGSLAVDATLLSSCSMVAGAAAISFGSFSSLLPGNQVGDSGSTFRIACSADMNPLIFATAVRNLTNGTSQLPFSLSLTPGAASDDMPSTLATAEALPMTQDGTAQDIHLYARVLAGDYAKLPGGLYSSSAITVSVSY